MAKKRNSGIELLRIIAILMVIVYHWAWHGGIRTFSDMEFGVNVVFMQYLLTLGRAGCCIFALISGYFMIGSKSENHHQKVVSLAGATHFYYLAILIIMLLTKAVPVTKTLAVKSLLPLLFGTWYIIAYILLLLLVPFLNRFLNGLDAASYRRLVVILLVIWSVIPTASADAWEFSDLDFFLVMYVLGGYLRLYPIQKKLPWGIMAAGSYVLMLLSVIGMDLLGIVTKHRGLFDKAYYFGKINSVLSVFLAVSVFMCFSRMNFQNAVINRLGGTTLGIYLIHNNFLLRKWLFCTVAPNTEAAANPYLNVLVKTAVIFFGCAAVEMLRVATVGKWFDKAVSHIFTRRNAAKGTEK